MKLTFTNQVRQGFARSTAGKQVADSILSRRIEHGVAMRQKPCTGATEPVRQQQLCVEAIDADHAGVSQRLCNGPEFRHGARLHRSRAQSIARRPALPANR